MKHSINIINNSNRQHHRKQAMRGSEEVARNMMVDVEVVAVAINETITLVIHVTVGIRVMTVEDEIWAKIRSRR